MIGSIGGQEMINEVTSIDNRTKSQDPARPLEKGEMSNGSL